MTKPLHVAHCAKDGLIAAVLAEQGFTASTSILEGHFGSGNPCVGPSMLDLTHLTRTFGRPWRVAWSGVVLKAYPCCGSTYAAVGVMLVLRAIHGSRPEGINSLRARAHPNRGQILACEGNHHME